MGIPLFQQLTQVRHDDMVVVISFYYDTPHSSTTIPSSRATLTKSCGVTLFRGSGREGGEGVRYNKHKIC